MASELVLIVEDNEKNRKLARDVLRVKGYETMESDNAEEGIRLAQERKPALILMDLHLPGIDGIKALARLRSDPRTERIPVIAVTASVMSEDNQRIIAAGFDGLQTKPIHVNEFIRAVGDTLARSKGRTA
jgi:two-component system cell cycle response regulator DivK